MSAARQTLTVVTLWGGAPETLSDARRGNVIDAKKWRSCDEKKLAILAVGATVMICGCEPDDSGRPMASWLSRRSNRRRPGGRGHILGAALAAPRPYEDAYAYEPV